jgi:hypothetical protein
MMRNNLTARTTVELLMTNRTTHTQSCLYGITADFLQYLSGKSGSPLSANAAPRKKALGIEPAAPSRPDSPKPKEAHEGFHLPNGSNVRSTSFPR